MMENGLGVICACLPTYRPLLTKGTSIPTDVRAWYSSLRDSSCSWGGGPHSSKTVPPTNANHDSFDSRKHYNKIEDGTLDDAHMILVTSDHAASAGVVAGRDFPLKSIQVKNTTDMV